MARRLLASCALLAVMLIALPVLGFPNEEKPLAKLSLRASVAEVQKIYPKMRKLDREQFGAMVVSSPLIDRYYQPDVKLEGLAHPVALELRFWKGQLWVLIAYLGDNSEDDMVAWLQKTYGPPRATKPNASWFGTTRTIVVNSKGRWLSWNDNALSAEIQKLLMKEMHMRLMPTPTAGAGTSAPPR